MTNSYWAGVLSKRISRRRALAATGGTTLGSALLMACGSGDDGGGVSLESQVTKSPGGVFFERDAFRLPDETKDAVPDGVLTEIQTSDFTEAFDVYLTVGATADRFTDHAYEYLLTANRGPGIEPGSVEYKGNHGVLAESWEISEDGLSVTFKMRPNVKFHNIAPVNGRTMDIEDWRTSITRYMEIGSNSPQFNDVVDHPEFPDSNTMVLKLRAPYSPLGVRMSDYNFGLKIVPKELNDNPELSKTTMIGTNFRSLDKYEPSITREWKRHDEYWDGKPFIERWREPIIPEYANRYAQFLAKSVLSMTPQTREVLKLRNDAPDAIMIGQELNTVSAYRMLFGKREKETVPWKDARIRIAMQRAVDWPAVNRFASNADVFAAQGIEIDVVNGTHVPGDPIYYLNPWKGELGKDSENYIYNPQAVKQLVEAAGFPDGFDIDMYFNAGRTTTASQQNLDFWTTYTKYYDETNGLVRVNPVYLTRREYFDRIVYQADIKGIQMSQPSAGTDVDYLLFRNYSSNYHLAAFHSPELDGIIDLQRQENDPLVRAEHIKDFQRHQAKHFHNLPGQGRWNAFRFDWDWLRNTGHRGPNYEGRHLEWLDPNMPNRNG